MERTAKENIRLGVFVILGTIALLVGAYLIGDRQNLFGDTFELQAIFKNVNGLQTGNNVRYSGINVGTVARITMENDTTILVAMNMDGGMLDHIKQDAIATIGSDGLVGSMIVSIVPGNGMAPLVKEGDMIKTYSRIGAKDMLSTLNVTNENAALLTKELLITTAAINEGQGVLGKLLYDTIMAQNLTRTAGNLRRASYQADQILQKMNTEIQELDLEQSIAGILLTDSLSGKQFKDVIQDIGKVSKRMDTLSVTLDDLVQKINNAEGTVNYLVTDTILVKRIEHTMENIEEGTAKFNENMEALKHNFLTRRYFKKLEKEQKKAQKE
ncbi:MAG: MlaD family protein [Flavobacteriaceae bacterium]|nr:MlaD family protein [Flavobacteriaceae bacterium]